MRSIAISLLLFGLVSQSCSSPRKLSAKFPQESTGVLLVTSSRPGGFFYVVGDTTYVERIMVDKPSYFYDFDTLVRKGSERVYYGKEADLEISDSTIFLHYVKGKNKGLRIQFYVADAPLINQWNKDKNFFKIRQWERTADYPGNRERRPAFDEKRLADFRTDFNELVVFSQSSNQTSFDSAMTVIKEKYR